MEQAPAPQVSTKTIGFFGIFLCLLAIFLLAPLFANNDHSYIGLQISLALLLASFTYSISSTREILITGGWIVLLFFTLDSISLYFNSIQFMVMAYIVFVLYLFFAIFFLLKEIVQSHMIDNNLIFGALTVYLLIGILWAKLYFLDALLFQHSFRGLLHDVRETGQLGENFSVQFDLFYYSFTTLTTLGLGDISPVHHIAKTLTVLEAIFGQLFVAIVISKLVSIWHRSGQTTDSNP